MKKTMIVLLIAVFCLVAFTFVRKSLEPAVHKPFKIITIVKSTDLVFWRQVESGVKTAGAEFQADISFWAPAQEKSVEKQIALMEKAIAQKPDAIILAASDYRLLAPVSQKAKEQGILLLTIDSRLPEHLSSSHIATDNLQAARQAANYLAKKVGGKGKIAIVSSVAGTGTAIEREQGFLQEIGQYPQIEIIDTKFSGSDVMEAYRLTKQILQQNPDLKGIFGSNESATVGMALALKDMGKSATVRSIGFDSPPATIASIEEGVLDATVVQKPFNMGYLAIQQAVSILQGNPPQSAVRTDSVIITRDNMYLPENQKLLYPFEMED